MHVHRGGRARRGRQRVKEHGGRAPVRCAFAPSNMPQWGADCEGKSSGRGRRREGGQEETSNISPALISALHTSILARGPFPFLPFFFSERERRENRGGNDDTCAAAYTYERIRVNALRYNLDVIGLPFFLLFKLQPRRVTPFLERNGSK